MSASRGTPDQLAIESSQAKQFVSELIRNCPANELLNAQDILRQHPELEQCHSQVLDLAYEEYCRRVEAGEQVAAEEFADRFPPEHRLSLIQLLEVHARLDGQQRWELRDFDSWPSAGEKFLDFTLIEEIGRGAFSRVFVAAQPKLGDRHVVVKVCVGGNLEAHTLGRLNHAHIVPVHWVGDDTTTGLTGICMPLLSRATLYHVIQRAFADDAPPKCGKTLLEIIQLANHRDTRIQSEKTDPGRVKRLGRSSYVNAIVELGVQLADALAYTHRQGFCHCDVKPSNVLLTPDAKAMLLDFNLAFGRLENQQRLGGTLPYMAPEQLRVIIDAGDEPTPRVDARTDIFALGVTMYESLSGRLPFGTISHDEQRRLLATELLHRQQRGPTPLHEVNKLVDQRLSRVIQQCLSIDPEQRPASADALAKMLRHELAPGQRTVRWMRERRTFCTATAAVCIVAAGIVGAAWLTREPFAVREMQAGEAALVGQNFQPAVLHFTNVLEVDPSNSKARFLRGRAKMFREQFEDAAIDFLTVDEQLSERNGYVQACLAHCFANTAKQLADDDDRSVRLRSGMEYRHAIDAYNVSIEHGAASAVIYNNLAYCYLQRNLFQKATVAYQHALEFEFAPVATYLNLTRLDVSESFELKRVPNMKLVDQLLEIGDEYAIAHLKVASAYAVAARFTSVDASTDETGYINRALQACEDAVMRGLDPADLSSVATIHSAIKEHPRFQRLSTSPKRNIAAKQIELMVDPLEGVSTHPF